ncbi:MAG TPA: fasciclin domain-containing protein [Rhodospirillales bacterium]|nr:fasciclin domain-containing protein [Rhodospirillales bacterium]
MTSLLNKCFNIVSIAVIALSVSIGAASATSKNIVETAVQSGKFNTLVTALKAAGLVNTLNGKGPFTVFAPSDTAFSKLPAGTVDDLLKPENKAKLVSILAYHVIPGKIMSGDIAGKKISVKTVQGSKISVDAMYGVKINDSNVVSADIAATNGVIHVIDKVLMPN